MEKYNTLKIVESIMVENCKRPSMMISPQNTQFDKIFENILNEFFDGDEEEFSKYIESYVTSQYSTVDKLESLYKSMIRKLIIDDIVPKLTDENKWMLNELNNCNLYWPIECKFDVKEWERFSYGELTISIDDKSFVRWFNTLYGCFSNTSIARNMTIILTDVNDIIRFEPRHNILPKDFFKSNKEWNVDEFNNYLKSIRKVYLTLETELKNTCNKIGIIYAETK